MPNVFKDRVQETSTTTGTGTYTLAGAVSGFAAFNPGDGNTVYYCAVDGTSWEVGIGTYTVSGTTLSRDTIFNNHLGNQSAINWAAGTRNIFNTIPATIMGELRDISLLTHATNKVVKSDGSVWTADFVAINEISDVTITSVAQGERLTYNGAAWINELPGKYVAVSADKTIGLSDLNNVDEVTVDTKVKYTFPKNTTTAIPVGASGKIIKNGTGEVEWDGESGVTLNTPGNFTAIDGTTTNVVVDWYKTATDIWNITVADVAATGQPLIEQFGWMYGHGGGNTVQRLTFASDTSGFVDRSDLTATTSGAGGLTNGTHGWAVAATAHNIVHRTTLSDDTTDALDRSDSSTRHYNAGAVSDGTKGWIGGGTDFAPGTATNIIDRLIYATDTTDMVDRSDLTVKRAQLGAWSDGSVGWFVGGFVSPARSNVIDRITYSTDTTNAINRADLSDARAGIGTVSNGTHGWCAGGNSNTPSDAINTIDRFIFASDTTDSVDRADLIQARQVSGALTDGTFGWFLGGFGEGIGPTSTIDRYTFSSDTTNAIDRADLPSTTNVQVATTNNDTGAGY